MPATAPLRPARARRLDPADLLEDLAVSVILGSAAIAVLFILALMVFI